MAGVPATDVHQHLWPEPFVAALARRDRACPASAPGRVELAGEPRLVAAARRRRRGRARGGPARRRRRPGAARPLVPARDRGAGPRRGPAAARRLARGRARPGPGVRRLGRARARRRRPRATSTPCSTAGPSASPSPPARSRRPSASRPGGPVLEALERRDAPLLVHPGPGPEDPGRRPARDAAAWWPALTGYVAALQAAWLAWAGWGRAAHPRLRVVFAALAGLAPLHAERLAARGGPAGAVHDPLVFYDTSSYGPAPSTRWSRVVGIDAARPRLRPPRRGRAAPPRPRRRRRDRALKRPQPRRACSTGRRRRDRPPRPTRDLDAGRARGLGPRAGADPARWRHLVRHDPARARLRGARSATTTSRSGSSAGWRTTTPASTTTTSPPAPSRSSTARVREDRLRRGRPAGQPRRRRRAVLLVRRRRTSTACSHAGDGARP